MDTNSPVIAENEFPFCKVDKALAQAFLRDAENAVKMSGAKNARELQSSVIKSLLVFHEHRQRCGECKQKTDGV